MKKHIVLILAGCCLLSFMILCRAFAFETITREVVEKKIVKETDVVKTADNFIIVFDGSNSTNGMLPGTEITKIAAAKELLKERDKWLPDLEYNCGLYITSGWWALKTVQEMQPCNQQALDSAIEQLPEKGKGNDLLMQSMVKLEKVIEPLSGQTSVIWFTDGIVNEIDSSRNLADLAKDIENENDVRFYIISGTDENQKEGELEKVASTNAESQTIALKELLDNPDDLAGALYATEVSTYVQKVPESEVVGFVTDDMLFDTDSDTIRSEYTEELDKMGKLLQENPDISVVIQGHADNVGAKMYNLELSAKRAGQVREYLLNKYNIEPDRVAALWYGDKDPIADNKSEEGRQQNRRVEIAVRGIR